MRESRPEWFTETPDVLKSACRCRTVFKVLDLEIGGDDIVTMVGPCSVDTEIKLMATAHHIRRAGARILCGGTYKPRSSPCAFHGHGPEGLKILARVREESGLAIVTEVMSVEDVPVVAECADILQIGTRNMENHALLEAAAHSGRPVLLKRGMAATIEDFLRSAQLILDNGNSNVILCESGICTFDKTLPNTFDVASIALLKHITHLPVIADLSHATGHSDLIPPFARIAAAVGADGLLVEVHPNLDKTWSDGEQTIDFAEFEDMMISLEPYLKLRKSALHSQGLPVCEILRLRAMETV